MVTVFSPGSFFYEVKESAFPFTQLNWIIFKMQVAVETKKDVLIVDDELHLLFAEWNAKTKGFDSGLRKFPSDAEEALSKSYLCSNCFG